MSRIRLLALALLIGLAPLSMARAETLSSVYNGDRLHVSFEANPIWGCPVNWIYDSTTGTTGWYAKTPLSIAANGCNGGTQVVTIRMPFAGAMYLDSVYIWGASYASHFGRVTVGTTVKTSSLNVSPGAIDMIPVQTMVTGGYIQVEKIGLDYVGSRIEFTGITQVQFNFSYDSPTATITQTPRPTGTGAPTTTTIPNITPVATVLPPQTRIAPGLTAAATIDTCADDITIPCATYQFPTLSVPTFYLPSPTLVALLPTNTPAPMTFTPSMTTTPSNTPTYTATPGPSPTASPPGDILPTLNVTAWYDGAGALTGGIPTLIPLLSAGFDTGSATPQGIVSAAEQFGAGAGRAIALAKSLELSDFNKLGGIITFAFLIFAFSVLIEVAILVLPLIEKFLQWLWRLIKLIPFIE
jgi:hypothetical protein